MSNLDPLARAAPAAQSIDPVAAEIASLTADAEALRTMVSAGDIVAARVLPFNGLTDLVEILGKRVAAQLPPTVRPGETLILEVQGFDGDRIVVRNLGVDPQSAGQPGQGQRGGALPPTPAPVNAPLSEQLPYTSASGGAPPLAVGSQTVALPPQIGAAAAGEQAAAGAEIVDDAQVEGARSSPGGAEAVAAEEPQIAPPMRPGITLPRSVLIRASVEPTDGPGEPPPAGSEEHPRVTFNVPSRAIETEKSLEARLIAARTTFARPGNAAPPRAASAPNQRGPVLPAPAPQARAVSPPAISAREATVKNAPHGTAGQPQRASPAPPPPATANVQRPGGASWIETMTRTVMAKANLAAPSAPAEEAAPGQTSPPPELHSATALATAPRLAESYREPTVLLRALRLPVTPSNVAAAKLALESPQRLPHALATLERALPLGNADPRVNTLRTLAAFVGNPDPRSEAFPAQISAYVSHVLEGPEPKLTALLQLFARTTAPTEDADDDAAPEAQTAPDAQAGESDPNAAPVASPAQPGAPGAAHQQAPVRDAPPAQADTSTQARIAERTTAMEYDLKSVLQSFISQPPPGAAPASLAAAHAALAAVTAAQLGIATAQTDPRVLALEIPLPFTANGSPAKIMVSRDKPDGEGPLSADNFHIAFVLDTKNVGTVAIDLMTVGREVSVAVKSETPRYAAAFNSKLDELGRRLGHLRYNVSSMESGIVSRAGATTTIAAPEPPPQDRDDDSSAWDLRV